MENLDQVTTHEEQSDNLCAGSNMPKVNDRIRYRLPGEDWVVAVVTGRGGKATGKNKYYFNIRNIDNGGELGIHLGKEFHENTNFRDNEDIVQKDMEENRQRLHPVIVDFEQTSIQQDSEQMVD